MIDASAHALFRKLCGEANSFVLTTHINPDGDALGSEIGLARFLKAGGKDVRIVNKDPTPEILRFVEHEDHPVEHYDPAIHDAVLAECDLVVLVDNSAPDRLGSMEPVMLREAARTLCIDHHPARDTPWARQILDEKTCATAVLIYELTTGAGWTPDRAAAEAIYVGLATDTGFFRYNSTNARAYEIAAELVRLGVKPSPIYQAIYERNSLALTRLMGHALVNVRLFAGGAVASVKITHELIERIEAQDVDTAEITTALLAMDGITVALLFREQGGGRVKVSLRSKGSLDVHGLALEFGGGGHRNASGIVLAGSLEDVARQVIGRAESLLA